MPEYIEREALLSDVDKAFRLFAEHDDILRLYSDARCSVIYAPAADVAPVVHGRWEPWTPPHIGMQYSYDMMQCSVCGCTMLNAKRIPAKYCYNCGAHMKDGE